MTELVLGVDGGGSKTIAVLVDRQGQVIRFAKGGGINPQDQVHWQAEASRVLDALAVPMAAVAVACFGAPGYGEISSLSTQQADFFQVRCAGTAIVENDVRLAFDGAFLNQPGVLLLVGTGSMAWASDGDRHQRIGGWGEIYSDEGSGYWIGREVLSMATRHLDRRIHAPALSAAVLRHLSISGGNVSAQLFDWVYSSPHRRSAIASLAQLVSAQAMAGDPVAEHLMNTACDLQAAHVMAAKKIYGAEMPWALTGGVGKSPYVQQRLMGLLGTPSQMHLPPVGGGAWRAAQAAGWAPDQTWIRQLRSALAEHGVHS